MRYAWTPEDTHYPEAGQEFFTFLRRNSDDRYSSRTMMAVVRQIDARQAPLVVFDSEPMVLDEMTEVKRGGINAAGIVLRDGRVLLATRTDVRRQGYGSALLNEIVVRRRVFTAADLTLQFWVTHENIDGVRFLVARGLVPIANRAPNMICYGYSDAAFQ